MDGDLVAEPALVAGERHAQASTRLQLERGEEVLSVAGQRVRKHHRKHS